MSKITQTITYCDFCQVTDSKIVPLGWFRVASVYAEMRKATQCDVYEGQDWHACARCGTMLHHWLGLLGIDHTFIPAKGDLREGAPQFGNILVGVRGKADG